MASDISLGFHCPEAIYLVWASSCSCNGRALFSCSALRSLSFDLCRRSEGSKRLTSPAYAVTGALVFFLHFFFPILSPNPIYHSLLLNRMWRGDVMTTMCVNSSGLTSGGLPGTRFTMEEAFCKDRFADKFIPWRDRSKDRIPENRESDQLWRTVSGHCQKGIEIGICPYHLGYRALLKGQWFSGSG